MSLKVKTMAEWMAEGEEPEICFGWFCWSLMKSKKIIVLNEILNNVGVKFGVLGTEESSSGDAVKRAGNEFLFQMQAMMNIQVMNAYNVKRIVTTCPHSYNTLKNEYKGLGGKYDVLHHTEYINELVTNNRFKIKGSLASKKVTYHDPCYLGRANGVISAPRNLLNQLDVELVEMKRNKRRSFCCGAGGAQMFKEPEAGQQDININRTEEAILTKAKIIATACPFCNTMMTDGVKNLAEGEMDVLDIAELIVQAEDL